MNYLRGTYGSKTSSADDSARPDSANDLSGMAGEGASFDASAASFGAASQQDSFPSAPSFDAGAAAGGIAPFDPYSLGEQEGEGGKDSRG